MARLGVIGKPSDWLIASIPDYKEAKKVFDIDLIDISLEELMDIYLSLSAENKYQTDYFDNNELNNADKFYRALKTVVAKYNLEGLTIRCFDLLSSIKMTGCLALSKLNDEGIIATCEGDISSMISMYLVKKFFNVPSFQANPSVIDVENNKIILAHCSCPLKMLSHYKFNTHFESKIGVAIEGDMFLENVTIFRMNKDLKHFSIYEGKIVNTLHRDNLCRTQIEVECNDDISSLLRNPMGNHQIVFYGHHKKELESKLKISSK